MCVCCLYSTVITLAREVSICARVLQLRSVLMTDYNAPWARQNVHYEQPTTAVDVETRINNTRLLERYDQVWMRFIA